MAPIHWLTLSRSASSRRGRVNGCSHNVTRCAMALPKKFKENKIKKERKTVSGVEKKNRDVFGINGRNKKKKKTLFFSLQEPYHYCESEGRKNRLQEAKTSCVCVWSVYNDTNVTEIRRKYWLCSLSITNFLFFFRVDCCRPTFSWRHRLFILFIDFCVSLFRPFYCGARYERIGPARRVA